jgi:hypothetical protein
VRWSTSNLDHIAVLLLLLLLLFSQVAALPCSSILDQHVCDLTKHKYQFGAEGRYCYRATNASSLAAQKGAQEESHRAGASALKKYRSKASSSS